MSSLLNAILRQDSHRPWPLPTSPWIATQTWHDLLFAHWEVPADQLRSQIPSSLPLDLYEGRAWLGVVPFGIMRARTRSLPPIPGSSTFPEINVRTYVTLHGKPGVYFFSLDVNNLLAVIGARWLYHLPYYHAYMSLHRSEKIHFVSRRCHPFAPHAAFESTYGAVDKAVTADRDSLLYWLTERYCLYSLDRHQNIYRAEIHHLPWLLQVAEADIQTNTIAVNTDLKGHPPLLLHYAQRQDVLFWLPEKI